MKTDLFSRDFLLNNLMGPNCVTLAEELTQSLTLPPNSRILDLGCGTGLSSIYLAHRYPDAIIYATDLWISATDNYARICQFGLSDRIIPIHADAHNLPYAEGFFDAVISIDSYHYYGAVPGFLEETILPLLRPGGMIAIAIPGLQADLDQIPEELAPYWQADMNFYSPAWWHKLWSGADRIDILDYGCLASHAQAWQDWLSCDEPHAKHDIGMMAAEGGRYFASVYLMAAKDQ